MEQDKQPMTPMISSPDQGFRSLYPSKEQWQVMEFMAKTFQSAGALPKGIDTVPKMMVVLQAGADSGLTPLAALNSFYIVNGNVRMYGEQKVAQVIKAGHKIYWGYKINEKDELIKTNPCSKEYAAIVIERKDNGQRMGAELTMKEAQERGMDRSSTGIKDPWKKFPENMLKFKVFDMVAKFVVPDALQGIQIDDDEEKIKIVDISEEKGLLNAPKGNSLSEALQDEPEEPVSVAEDLGIVNNFKPTPTPKPRKAKEVEPSKPMPTIEVITKENGEQVAIVTEN